MLKPYKIDLHIYAESQAEADALQAELLAFVREKREQGIAVSANKLIKAIQQFKNTIIVNNYLKI